MEKGRLIIDGVDVSGSVGSAASVPYSNTNSGLEATNTQGAIDELATSVTELNSNLGGFTPVIDENGKITGYKTTVGGADTVFPFKKSGLYDYYNFKNAVFLSKNSNDSIDYNGKKFIRNNSVPCLFIHFHYGGSLGFIILSKETEAFNGTADSGVNTTPIQFQTPNGDNAYYAHSGLWGSINVNPLKVTIDGITNTSSFAGSNTVIEGGDFLLTFLGILADEML